MVNSTTFTPWQMLSQLPRRQVAFSVLLGLAQSALAVSWPLLLYAAIDPLPSALDPAILSKVAAVIALFTLAQWLAYYQASYNFRLIDTSCSQLADKLFQQLVELPWLCYRARPRAYFYDLMMADFWRVRQGVNKLLDTALVSSVIIAAMLVAIGVISPILLLFCLGSMLVIGLLGIIAKRYNQPLLRLFQAGWREQHRWVAALLDKYELFKMGRGIEQTGQQHQQQTAAFLATNTTMLKSQLVWRSWLNWVGNLARIGMLLVGGYLMQQQALTPQAFLITLLLLSIIQSHVQPLSGVLFAYLDGQEAAKTIASYFGLDRDTPSKQIAQPLQAIGLHNIQFSYPNSTTATVNNGSYQLEAGNVYLWRGANGSGKSTMARILLGHISPNSGTLSINHLPCDFSALSHYRSQMALIDQHATLFAGTINQNVWFGQSSSPNAAVKTHPLTKPLLPKNKNPNSYDVGERGEALSGGEARRIALLRELITQHQLLVLDEPANHLDKATVQRIKETIDELKADKIIVIISHQNDFDLTADQIVEFK